MTTGSNLFKNFPSPEAIKRDVAIDGFCIYPDAISLELLTELKKFWVLYFGGNRPRREVLTGNLRLGEENFNSFTDSARWNLYRDFDFLWNQPTHALTRELTVEIHKIRNLAQGFHESFGLEFASNCYGIYISTSCYPPVHGFLRGHTDGHHDLPILQFMVPITFKGIDYDDGGLYIENKDQKKILVDDFMQPGSVVFFDGRMKHGVDHIVQKSKRAVGRIATFAIPTYFATRQELPRSIRKLEDFYFAIQSRVSRLGKPSTIASGEY